MFHNLGNAALGANVVWITPMLIGVSTFELHLDGCQSLKEKRLILKGLKQRISQRFNVSIAEVAFQDLWQRTELAVVVVSQERQAADRLLAQVANFIDQHGQVRVIERETYFL